MNVVHRFPDFARLLESANDVLWQIKRECHTFLRGRVFFSKFYSARISEVNGAILFSSERKLSIELPNSSGYTLDRC
jgi:hypothetical protein